MFQYIVDQTNNYAEEKLHETTLGPRSLFRNWQIVTVTEMKAFIAIIINMGLVQMQDMKDYWSRHETTNIQFFHHVMNRDRFFQIFNMLHVGNRNAQSRTEKIQPFLELLKQKFQSLCTPKQSVAIDEATISFNSFAANDVYARHKH